MAKVLVTGANGFIGSHLANSLLALGHEVTCLVRKTSRIDLIASLPVRLVHGDVTDRDSLAVPIAGSDVVYHMAGCTRALRVAEFFRINEEGARNVAGVCAEQASPPVLVHVSSLAAAGPAVGSQLRTEADEPAPVSNYGRSKLAGERAIEPFAEQIPITIVRPPIVLGAASRELVPLLRPIARCGVHVVTGLGRQRVSLIHIDDLISLLILAAERGERIRCDSATGRYFAACEEHPTYAELGQMIGRALGRERVMVLPSPPRMVWVVATVNEAISRIRRRPAVLNFDKAREARAGSWICSPQAAADELGFAVAAPLAERLQQTAEWYRQEGWL